MDRRFLFRAACLLSAVGSIAACGGGGSSTSASALPVTPPAPTETLVAQGNFALMNGLQAFNRLGRFDVEVVPFSTTRAGALHVVVDYTHAGSEILPLLFKGACSEELAAAFKCELVDAVPTRAKPYLLDAASLPAGSYTLAIQNLSLQAESGLYRATLTY
jgi:hypothetical protein